MSHPTFNCLCSLWAQIQLPWPCGPMTCDRAPHHCAAWWHVSPFPVRPKSCILHCPLPHVSMSYVLCVPRLIVCIFKICVLLLVPCAQQSLCPPVATSMCAVDLMLHVLCRPQCPRSQIPGPSTRLCTLESPSCVTCPMTFNPLSNVTCPRAPMSLVLTLSCIQCSLVLHLNILHIWVLHG